MPTSVTFIGNNPTFTVTGTPRSDSPMIILHYSTPSFPIAASTQTVVGNFPVLGVQSLLLLRGTFNLAPTDFNVELFLNNIPLVVISKYLYSNNINFSNESASFFMRVGALDTTTKSFIFYLGFEQIFTGPLQLSINSNKDLTLDTYIVYSSANLYNTDILRDRPDLKIPYYPTTHC